MRAPLRHDETLEAMRRAQHRFAELLRDADPDAPVPACPGWAVRDLAAHVGAIHRWAAAIVLSGAMTARSERHAGDPLADWYAGTAQALRAALAAVDPEESTPNFLREDGAAEFWARRQLHETTVHLHDLEAALGALHAPIQPERAADGVDEVLSVFFARLAGRGSPPDLRGNVRVRATDTGDAWVLLPGRFGEFGAEGVACDAEISGTAHDLYLVLWGRRSPAALTVTGDAAEALLAGPTSL